jgi:hypothetical protein
LRRCNAFRNGGKAYGDGFKVSAGGFKVHAAERNPADKTLAINESNLPIKNALKKRHK